MKPLSIEAIAALYRQRGDEQYSGEPVTHLEHALQAANLAELAGESDMLVTAALLHDLGHLLHDLEGTPTLRGVDDTHQDRAVPFLRGLFPESLLLAIRGHVDAKRYLCATRPGYYAGLSEDSKRSLQLQGGAFGPAEAQAFIHMEGARDAVRLRIWDDRAKAPGVRTPDLEHFLARAQRAAGSA
ncbi:MAG: phosphonate degradation HD-domain oxygenase [Betaproteobacteria bacterium]